MAWLYNGYCFATLQEIGDTIQSQPFEVGASAVYFVNSYVVNGGSIQMSIFQKTNVLTSQQASMGTITRTFPTCTTVGYVPPSNAISEFANQYLAFDATIFGIIVGSSLVALALGYSTGAITKLMNRT